MGHQRTTKRLIAASVAIAGLSVGLAGAHADTLHQRVTATNPTQDLTAAGVTAPVWPSIAPTVCAAGPNSSCGVTLAAGPTDVVVNDTTNGGAVTVHALGFDVNAPVDGQPTYTLAGGATSTIKVPQNTSLTITFTQDASITDPIELSFPSLPQGSVHHSVAAGVDTITIDPIAKPGTSVFQPGANKSAPRQVAQGLVGILVVTPTGCTSPTLSCGYDGTAFQDEAIIATTDVDKAFADAPATYDMDYFGQARDADGNPRQVYHLINGKSFPDTDVIDAHTGDSVLLRYVNAGVTDKTLGLLGLRQHLLARNSRQYSDSQTFIAPLIGPGETADVAVSIPTTASAGQRYPLVDQSRQMNHGNAAGFGGALTFLNVWAGVAVPHVSNVTYAFATGTLAATLTASALSQNITGYQLAVTNTAGDVPTFDPTVNVTPAPSVALSTPVTVPAGKFVWIRAVEGTTLSDAVSVQAVETTVSISPTLVGSTLNATATAIPVGATVTGLYYSVNDNTPSATGTSFSSAAAANSISGTATLTDLVAGDVVYVRAASATIAGGFSPWVSVTAVGPTVGAATYNPTTGEVSALATSSGQDITGYEMAVTPNAGGTPDWDPVTAVTAAPTVAVSAPVTASAGEYVWLRVLDAGGVASTPAKTVVVVNQAPSFTKGADVSVPQDSSDQAITGWATGIKPGPASEASQTVTFDVTASVPSLFSAGPVVSADGTLTFTPSAGVTGTAHVTVTAHDNGGTVNGGVDTSAAQTFDIVLTAVIQKPTASGTLAGTTLTVTGTSDPSLTVVAAEYFVGTDPGAGSGTVITGTFGTSSFSTDVDLGAVPADTVFVRVKDSSGTWGDAIAAIG